MTLYEFLYSGFNRVLTTKIYVDSGFLCMWRPFDKDPVPNSFKEYRVIDVMLDWGCLRIECVSVHED